MLVQENTIQDEDIRWYIIGSFFGYPECCIDFFVFRRKHILDLKLTKEQKAVHKNNGFIPCPKCANKVFANEITIEDLIKDRVCSTPYPHVRDSELNEFLDFVESKQKTA